MLPHGIGREVRVLVFAEGEAANTAIEAGADEVGGDELIEKVAGGYLNFGRRARAARADGEGR